MEPNANFLKVYITVYPASAPVLAERDWMPDTNRAAIAEKPIFEEDINVFLNGDDGDLFGGELTKWIRRKLEEEGKRAVFTQCPAEVKL